MAIRLICVCGRLMALPEKYAGQHVQCPDCYAMLYIPTREEDLSLIRWSCSCGQRLKARPRAGGQKVRCPNCSSKVSVPFSKGHGAPAQETFTLDDATGVVKRVPKRGETRRAPAKSETGDAYEVAAGPPAAPAGRPQQPGKPARPAAKKSKPPPPVLTGEDEAYAEEVEEDRKGGSGAPGA